MPMKRVSSLQHFAVREATAVAAEHSRTKQRAGCAHDYCKYAKSAIEFQILSLQAEQRLLADFHDLPDSEKMSSLFTMMDKDRDGKIASNILAHGLSKVHGTMKFEEKIISAIDQVITTDDNPGEEDIKQFNYEQFELKLNQILDILDCKLIDLAEMLIVQVVFSTTGSMVDKCINRSSSMESFGALSNSLLKSTSIGMSMDNLPNLNEELNKDNDVEKEFQKALIDERMKVLFNLFDYDQTGGINFKEVVLGMYKVTEGIDQTSKAAVDALLMFGDDHRTLNYKEFTKLIINFIAASPEHVQFDDVADSMTRHAAQPLSNITADDITHLFAMDNSLLTLMELQNVNDEEKNQQNEENNTILSNLSTTIRMKINRLFDLWDNDSDDHISFQELALGLRKFQETTQLKDTVEESYCVMNAFDTDHDSKLNRNEFALFIQKFSTMIESDLLDLVDFMIVAAALKENGESEKAYMNAMKESDIYYWGC